MAVEAGTAFVGVEFKKGDLGALESQTRAAGGRFSGIWGSAALKAVGVIGAAFAGMKAIDFAKSAISEANDLNETVNKVGVVFGDASGSVLKFGETSATAIGQSKNEALGAAGTFGNLFRALKLGEGQSARMSTKLVGLASDLASFNNVDPGEALEALRSGLVGETEPLRKFGVNMNDATLRAEALKLGLIDSGKAGGAALDPAIKAQAAYALILDQTKLAQGDFQRTSGGLANQQRILSAQWTDMKATLGGALLPIVVRVVSTFNAAIPTLRRVGTAVIGVVSAIAHSDAASSVVDGFRSIIGVAGSVFGTIRDLVVMFQNLRDHGASMGQTLSYLAEVVLLRLGVDFDTTKRVVADVGSAIARVVSVFRTVAGAVRDATAPLIAYVTNTENLHAALEATVAAIQRSVGFVNQHREAFVALGAGFVVVVAGLAAYGFATTAATAATAALGVVMAALPVFAVIAGLTLLVASLIYLYRNNERARAIMQAAWSTIQTVVVGAVQKITAVIQGLVTIGTALWRRFGGVITSIARNQFNAVLQVISGVMTVIRGVINVVLGLIHGDFGRVWTGVKQIVSGALTAILGVIRATWGAAFTAAKALGGKILDGVKGGIGDIAGFVSRKVHEIPGALGNLSGLLYDAGSQIIQGLLDGITSKIDDLEGLLNSVTGKIPDWKGPASHDAQLLTGSGELIMEGLIRGISSRAPALRSTLGAVTSDISGAIDRVPIRTGGVSGVRTATALAGIDAGGGRGGDEFRFFIGDREITDIVRAEVNGRLVATKQAIRAGRRP